MVLRIVHLLATFILLYSAYVEGQNTGKITQLSEEVVQSAGASGVLNCTVTSPPSVKDLVFAEWVFLNARGGPKTVTKDCEIDEEDNVISGKEKYQIHCEEPQSTSKLYSLTVNLLSFPDNGQYECRVRLSNEPEPVDTMKVKLTVLSPPSIQQSATPLTTDAYINGTVAMACSAEGVPGPNVTWGRANGKPLPLHRSYSIRNITSDVITNQTLTIVNITKEDTGIYRCSADNNIRPPDDFYSKLSVQYKPSVAPVEPTYGTPTGENTQIMIWCKVDGNPRPSMTWFKMSLEQSNEFADGQLELDNEFFARASKLSSDTKYKVEQKVMTVGSLSTMESMFYTLTLLTVEPGDMVYYVCKAENNHGVSSTAVQLYRVNTYADENNGSSYNTLSILLVACAYLTSWLY